MATIQPITENKKQYLSLLLLGDEQESMIDRYLERGAMYALFDGACVAVCVVTQEGEELYEIKNIAVHPSHQRKGYGKLLLDFVTATYRPCCTTLQVGTGDVPHSLAFYEACGFHPSHRLKNFFPDQYDHPIWEAGIQLVDMVYLQKNFSGE